MHINYWIQVFIKIIFAFSLIFLFRSLALVYLTPTQFLKLIETFLPKFLLGVSFLLLIIAFIITRLPFLLHYPVPLFAPDTNSYFTPFLQFEKGYWPTFNSRTPGYPIFIGLVLFFTNSTLAIIWAQIILLFLGSFFLVVCVYKFRPYLAFPTALAMTVFIISPRCIGMDFSLLSESLYSSSVIYFISFFILAINTKRIFWFFTCSVASILPILIRPAGIYFMVIFLFILIYLILKKYPVKNIFAFFLPFPLILLVLLTYNYFIIAKSSFFPNNSKNQIYWITVPYWTTDKNLTDKINKVITKYRDQWPEDDKNTFYNSWNFSKLYTLFRSYGVDAQYNKIPPDKLFLNLHHKTRMKIGRIAILRNPLMYTKFIATMFIQYFKFFYIGQQLHYRYIPDIYDQYYISKTSCFADNPEIMRDCVLPPNTPYITIEKDKDKPKITLIPTFLSRLHENLWKWQLKAIYRPLWITLFFLLFIINGFILIIKRSGNEWPFIVFIIASIEIGMALAISFFVPTIARFTSPGDFLIFLTPALFPASLAILWAKKRS